MIQPIELQQEFPVKLSNDAMSTTTQLWEVLAASHDGNLNRVMELAGDCQELIFGQYNYTPPIHFAVREGHVDLVKYLLDQGAHDPSYKTYPFLDTLVAVAQDRNYQAIADLLKQYESDASLCKFKGDNGEILYTMSEEQKSFQKAVNHNEFGSAKKFLQQHPEFAKDNSFSWYEGVLMMPSNRKNKEMLELLLSYGATVPGISKWGRAYYFKNYDIAKFLLEKGMDPDHMTWHHVTLLHDMAQEGDISKAKLLIEYGANIDPLEDEYCSTPLGLAARWGHVEMVNYLLSQNADPRKSGAEWATPLAWAQKKGHKEIENIILNAMG